MKPGRKVRGARARSGRKPKTRTALSCRVSISFSVRAGELGRALDARRLAYEPAGDLAFHVLANDGDARFTELGPGEEPRWTMVRRGDSRATSFWDHLQRKVYELAEDEVARVRVAKAAAVDLRVRNTLKHADAVLRFADARLGAMRLEMRFTKESHCARHGGPLLKILYGGAGCHAESDFPLDRLSKLGCLVTANIYLGDETAPVSKLSVEQHEVIDVGPGDFRAPKGYEVVRTDTPAPPATPAPEPGGGLTTVSVRDGGVTELPLPPAPEIARSQYALTAAESFTPDCLNTTRFGSMAITVHQDILDHARTAINGVASVLGAATLANGELTARWLSDLRAIRFGPPGTGSATAAGSGLYCLLEDRRVKATMTAPARGGTGYLDQFAVRELLDLMPREVVTGALLNSMRRWGINNTLLISRIFQAGGNLRDPSISESERIDIADAFTNAVYGTVRLQGLPSQFSTVVPGITTAQLLNITGSMNFASLGGAPLVPAATIGPTGNIVLMVSLPTTSLTATATWQITLAADAVANLINLAVCVLFPPACAVVTAVNILLKNFLEQRFAVVNAVAAGVTLTYDITYAFNAQRGVVEPTVSLISRTGGISVLATASNAPFQIQWMINSVLSYLGVGFNAWLLALTEGIRVAISDQLRAMGIECPLAAQPLNLRADSGGARSVSNSTLTLFAELENDPDTAAAPFMTQVPTATQLASDLRNCHAAMRSDLQTPAPVVPPAMPVTPAVAAYGGICLSQNALNHYAHARWRQRAYQWETSNPAEILRLMNLAPPLTFARSVHRMHAWLAAPPRVEIAEGAFANRDHPLVVFFDDIRICFQGIGPADGDIPGNTPMLELSVNAKAKAAPIFEGVAPDLAYDLPSIEIDDARVWDIADPNRPALPVPTNIDNFVLAIATLLLRSRDANGRIIVTANPLPWRNPIPSTRPQEFFRLAAFGALQPQDGYFEVLGRRRTLFMLPAIRSLFLELVNAPTSATLSTLVGAPVSLLGMTCPQAAGIRLRINPDWIIPP